MTPRALLRRLRLLLAMVAVALGLPLSPAIAGGMPQSDAGPAAVEDGLRWAIEESRSETDAPVSSLGLAVGDRVVPLRANRRVAYEPLRPGDWGVPDSAAIACLGWWAGSGEVLYAARHPTHIDVYLKRIEEDSAAPAFWLLKRIDLP